MNAIIRDKIREKKDTVRTLELKKTSLKEKLEMQKTLWMRLRREVKRE